MNLSIVNLKRNSFGDGKKLINFPIGTSSDYSAIKRITKADIEKWPRFHLQLFMDYCLSKEIYEVAAMIRDTAARKKIFLRIA